MEFLERGDLGVLRENGGSEGVLPDGVILKCYYGFIVNSKRESGGQSSFRPPAARQNCAHKPKGIIHFEEKTLKSSG